MAIDSNFFKTTRKLIYGFALVTILFAAISASAQTITSPTPGQVIKAGIIGFTWSPPGSANEDVAKISYSGDVAGNYSAANGAVNMSHDSSYFTSRDTTSDQCFFEITDQFNAIVCDAVGPFTIWSNDSVTFAMTAPHAGVTLHQDSTYPVSWTVGNVTDYAPDAIKLALIVAKFGDTTQEVVKTISSTLAHDATSLSLKLPRIPTSHAKFQITTADGDAQRVSGPWFAIDGASIAFTSPVKGSLIYGNSPDTISWSVSGPNGGTDTAIAGMIKVEYTGPSGVNNQWTVIDSVPATARSLVWTVPYGAPKHITYRIIADSGFIDLQSQQFNLQAVSVNEDPLLPTFSLEQNYPNPFSATFDNSRTAIPFSLAEGAAIGLRVYDVLGRTVALTAKQFFDAGNHEMIFDASSLLPGMYAYQLTGSAMQKMMMYVK